MAKTLQNFLIGVGLDAKDFDKGSREVNTSLGRIRSTAGIVGSAITGAFSAAALAAISAGNRVDDLVLKTEKFDTSTKFIYNYGNALRALGGDANEAVAAIAAAETALSSLQVEGQLPSGMERAAVAGIDISQLTGAATGEEFLRILAGQLPGLDEQRQRVVQESFGFSDATMRSLRQGSDYFDAVVFRAGELAGGFDEATEAARAYNRELAEFGTRLEGISNTLAAKMLPTFTGLLEGVNDFIDKNGERLGMIASPVTNAPVGAALAAGGGATIAAGATARAIGMSRIGSALSRAGGYGALAGAGLMAYGAVEEDLPVWYEQSIKDADRLQQRIGESVREFFNPTPNAGIYAPEVPTLDYVTNLEAGAATAEVIRAQTGTDAPRYAPAVPAIENNIQLGITLNGRALEHTVNNILERREQTTMDDLQSTVAR